jgi:HEXXH motif-containing protein
MTSITDATAPLSCFKSVSNRLLAETIVSEYSKAVVDLARIEFGNQHPGLFAVIENFVDDGGGWSPPFGAFESALRSGSPEALLSCAVQLGLLAHDCGVSGHWQEALREVTCLRLGQQAVVQLNEVSVDGGPLGYEVRGRSANGDQGVWVVKGDASSTTDPRLRAIRFDGVPVRVTTMYDLDAVVGMDFLGRDHWNVSQDLERVQQELKETERWLLQHCPSSLPWITAVLRHLVLTDPGPGLMESGSSRRLPGFVHVAHGDPLRLAEMLVHELSHQYYYIGTRLGPVDDGTDDTLYWSPVKQTGRPIANILLAYHAFGNVALLMRELRDGSAQPRERIVENLASVTDDLGPLQEALESTNSLTEVGIGLYEPLRNALGLRKVP